MVGPLPFAYSVISRFHPPSRLASFLRNASYMTSNMLMRVLARVISILSSASSVQVEGIVRAGGKWCIICKWGNEELTKGLSAQFQQREMISPGSERLLLVVILTLSLHFQILHPFLDRRAFHAWNLDALQVPPRLTRTCTFTAVVESHHSLPIAGMLGGSVYRQVGQKKLVGRGWT